MLLITPILHFKNLGKYVNWILTKSVNKPDQPILTGKPVNMSKTNSAAPDQAPHNLAFVQGIHCWLSEFGFENSIKATSLK